MYTMKKPDLKVIDSAQNRQGLRTVVGVRRIHLKSHSVTASALDV